MPETWRQAREREEAEAKGLQARRAERRDRLRRAGVIGNSERRGRAIMTVPRGLKLNTQEGVSMMLLSATTVSEQELMAAVRESGASREQLVVALGVMGFLVESERRMRP